jgi:predicted ester cyclase
VRALRVAFPDLHYDIEDEVIAEDAVAVRTTMSGTHRGSFFGLPPTGRSFRVAQMTIERFAGGKIVAHHRITDIAALLKQLGVAG